MEKKRSFWESFIAVMIFTAIGQILLEDLSRIGAWSISIRKFLIVLGFFIDLIFTVEFIIRSINSGKAKGWVDYFKNQKGWVDFVSSVPLILFSSGPLLAGMFLPGKMTILPFFGVLNILKVTKVMRVMRVARMLRMLRVLKIFKGMSDEEAEKRRLQVTKAITVSVMALILILIVSPVFKGLFYTQDYRLGLKQQRYVDILKDWKQSMRKRDIERVRFFSDLVQEDKDILYLYQGAQTIVDHLDGDMKPGDEEFQNSWFYTDFKTLRYSGFTLYYSVRDVEVENARINMLMTIIIIAQIIALMFFYYDPSIKKE